MPVISVSGTQYTCVRLSIVLLDLNEDCSGEMAGSREGGAGEERGI